MGFKLVRVDAKEPYKVILPLGTHFIGRGKFLNCNDNRVSRNHAELIVSKDSILLKSLHQNPCFVTKKSSIGTIVFSQPDSQVLSNGDQFGLIPDSYWYEVIEYTQESTESTESEDVTNKNENLNNEGYENGDKDSNTQYYNHEKDENMLNCSESLLDGVVNAPLSSSPENRTTHDKQPENGSESRPPENMDTSSPVESTHQPDESTNQNNKLTDASVDSTDQANEPTRSGTPTKRPHSEENSPCDLKKVKLEPVDKDSKDEAKALPIPDSTSNQTVKTEPTSPQDAKPGPSNDQGGSSKNDNGNPSTTHQSPTKPPNNPLRERCMYGANCYRRNPQHKAQFSHPSDADWGTGERGVCPWGASCMKADPRHWRDHEHPAGVRAPAPRAPRGNRPGMQVVRRHGNNFYINANAVHFYDDHFEVEDSDGDSVDYDYEF